MTQLWGKCEFQKGSELALRDCINMPSGSETGLKLEAQSQGIGGVAFCHCVTMIAGEINEKPGVRQKSPRQGGGSGGDRVLGKTKDRREVLKG